MQELPVLLIPGTLCTPDVFEQQFAALEAYAPHIETVRITTQDSITAMADLAVSQISAARPAAIIGFSMGGIVAMDIYRQAPQRVAKLAFLNSNYQADLPERKASRDAQLEQARQVGLEHIIRQHHLPNCLYRPNKAAEELIVDMALELGTGCYAAQSKALATRVDSSITLGEISCPTLILGGVQDRLCEADTQRRMHRLIEDSELCLLDDCGHFSMLEKPREVNTALHEWYSGA
jgi:pimeloyl-ACP methyl ester carboxylesterase